MGEAGTVLVTVSDFDVAEEIAALRGASLDIGAIVTFSGLVRDNNLNDGVEGLFLEHYPGMTEQSILAILAEAAGR